MSNVPSLRRFLGTCSGKVLAHVLRVVFNGIHIEKIKSATMFPFFDFDCQALLHPQAGLAVQN